MALKRITDEDVLGAIVELCGDGYCLVADVLPLFPGRFSHANRSRAVHRSVNRGLVIQRRGPDGREHVAVASEGWRLLLVQASEETLQPITSRLERHPAGSATFIFAP